MSKTVIYFFILLVFVAFNLMAEDMEYQDLNDNSKIQPIDVQDENLRGRAQNESEGLLKPEPPKDPKAKKAKRNKKNPEPVITPAEVPPPTNESAGFIELKSPYADKSIGGVWVTALKLESLTLEGRAFVGDSNSYSLSDFGPMTKSTLSLNYIGQPIDFLSLNSQLGVGLNLGFSSRDANLLIGSNFNIEGRLQNLDISLQPFWSIPITSLKGLSLVPFLQAGAAQMALATRDSLARFTYTGTFWGYGLDLDYRLSSNWSVLAEYYSRQSVKSSNPNDWSTTAANYQLGVTYKW